MPKIAGTQRNSYTKERVRQKRLERLKSKPKIEGVSDSIYKNKLGELLACGHMRIIGFRKLDASKDLLSPEVERRNMNIQISDIQKPELGDAPHITGYLQSASESDPSYKLKGWFNEDGTIRLELVK